MDDKQNKYHGGCSFDCLDGGIGQAELHSVNVVKIVCCEGLEIILVDPVAHSCYQLERVELYQ